MMQMVGSFADLRGAMIHERTRAGLDAAPAAGRTVARGWADRMSPDRTRSKLAYASVR
jgi:DNA invertase Pin-like site-specific DNA recombinase